MPRTTADLTAAIRLQSDSIKDHLNVVATKLPVIAENLEQMLSNPEVRERRSPPSTEAVQAIESARQHLKDVANICKEDGPALIKEVEDKLEGQRFLYKHILRQEQRNSMQDSLAEFRSTLRRASGSAAEILGKLKGHEAQLAELWANVATPVAPTLVGVRNQLDLLKNRFRRLGEIGKESSGGEAELQKILRARAELADELERDAQSLGAMLERALAETANSPVLDPTTGGLVPDSARMSGLVALRAEFDALVAHRADWRKQRDEDTAALAPDRADMRRLLRSVAEALGPVEADIVGVFDFACGAVENDTLRDAAHRFSAQGETLALLRGELGQRDKLLRTDKDERDFAEYMNRLQDLIDGMAAAKTFLEEYVAGAYERTVSVAAYLSDLGLSLGLAVARGDPHEAGAVDDTSEPPSTDGPPVADEVTPTDPTLASAVGAAQDLLDDTQVQIALREVTILERRGVEIKAALAKLDRTSEAEVAKMVETISEIRGVIVSRTETLVAFARSALDLAKRFQGVGRRPDLLKQLAEAGRQAMESIQRLRGLNVRLEPDFRNLTVTHA